MSTKKIEQILGRAERYENAVKDSDGDKLMNIIDCKPYDKNKQGIIHDIVEKYKISREESKADKLSYASAKSEARQVRRDERSKKMVDFEKQKADIDYKRKVESYRTGKGTGFFSKLMSSPQPAATTRYSKRKGKKSRKMARKKFRTKARNLSDIKFDNKSYDFTSGKSFL